MTKYFFLIILYPATRSRTTLAHIGHFQQLDFGHNFIINIILTKSFIIVLNLQDTIVAPTKKNLKETHLADQESTGIDVPAEVQGNIELAPAEVAKPKRGRPSTKAAKTDGNDEKKPKKIKKIPEQEAVATGEEKIIYQASDSKPHCLVCNIFWHLENIISGLAKYS